MLYLFAHISYVCFLFWVWRVESVGIHYPWWVCGTPYPLCGSHEKALWQRWLCNDKVVVCYDVLGGLSWGFNSVFMCTIISRCVCDPDTHNIHRGSPFRHILFWFVFSSFVSFKNLFEWKGEFSNTITSMETELLCHYRSLAKAIW